MFKFLTPVNKQGVGRIQLTKGEFFNHIKMSDTNFRTIHKQDRVEEMHTIGIAKGSVYDIIAVSHYDFVADFEIEEINSCKSLEELQKISNNFMITFEESTMTTYEMIAEADMNGLTYNTCDIFYQKDKGFTDRTGDFYDITIFNGYVDGLSTFIHKNNWKLIEKKKMNHQEIEEALGYEFEYVKEN